MRTIKIALIGLGTVGTGVAKLLTEQREFLRQRSGVDFDLSWAMVRDLTKPRTLLPQGIRLTDRIEPVINDAQVEIGIELMGTVEPAFEVICQLLNARKHVVTANKAVLAEHGSKLFSIARENDRAISFEASVAGGIPIIRVVSQGLAANRITGVAGILNGTSNYILSAMRERGISYSAALADAQRLGFAEADPTLDVDGTDTAQKLAILSRLAFHSNVDASEISRRGIDTLDESDIRYASELGYVIKLLALARVQSERLCLRVAPTLVFHGRPMAQVHGEYNAIQLTGDAVGELFLAGKGAGMMPTASSVVADLLDLTSGSGQTIFKSLRLWARDGPGPKTSSDAFVTSRFYLRYTIYDKPGTLAQIAGVLGKHGVSISSVIQHEASEDGIGGPVPLIIMTHLADEGALRRALDETEQLGILPEPAVCLHVAD